MVSIRNFLYYSVHPSELRSILQWNIWHNAPFERDEANETETLKTCFSYLDQTSRSFSAVIKELNHELLVPITIFYLILRGLDTVEDDMTLPLDQKTNLLTQFHTYLETDGWTFDGSGPSEKDRGLLVEFDSVVVEFKKLKPEYREIIRDICERMGEGMASFAHDAEFNENGVDSIKDYEKYCHYVAGLVGEGLTRLFVEGNLANKALLKRPDLHESMGQVLQQTNVIRDVKEDADERRRFWPKEVWSKYVRDFDDLFKKENRETALRCQSEMILLALQRVPDCLFYLAGMRDQSVFNFTAIPQTMALATLELCFRNPAMFEGNIKITKGKTCHLMTCSSQNLQILFNEFKLMARTLHKKNNPRDPNFLKISIACGKIEQFVESIFPSQDPKAIVSRTNPESREELQYPNMSEEERKKRIAEDKEARRDVMIMGFGVFGIMLVVCLLMIFVAWLCGARFDMAFETLRSGKFRAPTPNEAAEMLKRKEQGLPIVPKKEL